MRDKLRAIMHSWFLGVISIILIAPTAGFIAWMISHIIDWFWLVFWFYVIMGCMCILYDTINHIRSHRGLFEHSDGCLSLRLFKKKEEDT
ncbi:MAG: hypothetical protein ACTSRC_12140 [Candidatus Helarchaeota archaeon]